MSSEDEGRRDRRSSSGIVNSSSEGDGDASEPSPDEVAARLTAAVGRVDSVLETHMIPIELPAGSEILGEVVVFVDALGSLQARMHCATSRPEDRKVFAIVVGKALENFKAKHGIGDGDTVGRTRIVRGES